MNAAESESGHLLLVGDPIAALNVAAGMMRETQAELSIHAASAAALERLRRSDQPLVMVDVAIDLEDLLARLRGDRRGASKPAGLPAGQDEPGRLVGRTVADVERALILQTLAHCRGNRTSASTLLGISVRTMRNKLRSFIEDGIPVLPAP
jgi:DNA-binding NtrC family response regulator